MDPTSSETNAPNGSIAKAAKEILAALNIRPLRPLGTFGSPGSLEQSGSPAAPPQSGQADTPATVPVIAVVGAGGKSTTTFSLGSALAAQGRRVVISTTTKMGHDQTGGLTPTLPNVAAIAKVLTGPGTCLVVEHPDPTSPKVVGPPVLWFDELARSGLVDAIVLEADGARRRNAKAPGPHEPVLPGSTTHVVTLLGADALDRVIEDQGHRPMRIAAAAGCGPYDRLTPQRAARLMSSDIGGRKGVLDGMGFCAVISKVAEDNRKNAQLTADLMKEAGHGIVMVPFADDAALVVRPNR
jgi:probable selenium-dependent hydroxylase accessory protein YqeC